MSAFIKKDKERYEIGNNFLSRVFSIDQGHITTERIINFRTNSETVFIPENGSDNFVASFNTGLFSKIVIKSKDLQVASVKEKEGENCRSLEIFYEPYFVKGVSLSFREVYTAFDSKHYIYKNIYMKVSGENVSKVKLDFIDSEHFVLGESVKQSWSRPDMSKAHISGFLVALGQPVYINGMFFGNEFPECYNNIENNTAFIRYYSGKSLENLKQNENGEFSLWRNVFGSARSFDLEVIKSDFFDYIRDISLPFKFRVQYNSWYDHMMDINSENIFDSFFEIEKGLTQHGVPPVDSYVVDDGWNDYTGDFWKFNEKFPNELYEASKTAKKLSSDFGLWLGPRGGYIYERSFGKNMEKAGTGGYNKKSRDVCISHSGYVKSVTDLFIDYMDRFDINYWKLDGFAYKPCKSKNHGHITGGPNGMYFTTEVWERWIEIFEKMLSFRASQGKELWLNLTSYANPSPWFLQWGKSMWLQNSSDHWFISKSKRGEALKGSKADEMLSYRDDRYFDFCNKRQFQFPLSNIYNHDPVYGNTVKIKMTTDEYRKFMFVLAARGTAFWELYYSFNLFDDDMWDINAFVLRWAKKNFDILKNAKLIGETPAEGKVYGYSAWSGDHGFITLRNPANKIQSIKVKLDRIIGVGEGAADLTRRQLIPYCKPESIKTYSYGDVFEAQLSPHEVLVIEFAKVDKNDTAKIVFAKAKSNKSVEIHFDRIIHCSKENFKINGKTPCSCEIKADYASVVLTADTQFSSGEKLIIEIDGVSDCAGIAVRTKSETFYFDKSIIYSSEDAKLSNYVTCSDFTIKSEIENISKKAFVIAESEDGFKLLINDSEKVEFSIGNAKAVSEDSVFVEGKTVICAVRERNYMLKLYINGKLQGSAYDERLIGNGVDMSKISVCSNDASVCVIDYAVSFSDVSK